jgi:hypothetical protein
MLDDRQQQVVSLPAFIVPVAVMAGAIALLYVAMEHTFYWWDFVFYQNRALEVLAAWQDSTAAAWQEVVSSLDSDYNKLFTLPILPFLILFGPTRESYILGLVLAYLVPFSIVVGAIATQLMGKPRETDWVTNRLIFYTTTLLALLFPLTWVPTLRGWPDIGGAALMGLAIWLYFRDQTQRPYWWHIPAIGVAIAMAFLFRRHFAYSGIAFFVAAGFQVLVATATTSQKVPFSVPPVAINSQKWHTFVSQSIRLALMGISALVTLLLVAREFTYHAIAHDYRSLYTSWQVPFSQMIETYATAYGWGVWLLVAIAVVLALRLGLVNSVTGRFLLAYGLVLSLEWLVWLRYNFIHYTLHFTPLVILAVAVLCWGMAQHLDKNLRRWLLGTVIAYLSLNFLFGLTGLGTFSHPLRPVFAASYPPLVRQDYQEIVRLSEKLQELASQQQPILVAADSDILNRGLLRNAYWNLHFPQELPSHCSIPCNVLNFLPAPTIDSLGFHPLPSLLSAEFVVVAKPFQHRLLPEEQEVVRAVATPFLHNWAIAEDFKKLSPTFHLENGVKATIYQRTTRTSIAKALQTFTTMHENWDFPKPISGWLPLDFPTSRQIIATTPSTSRIQVQLSASKDRYFLYAAQPNSFPSSETTLQVSGKGILSNCRQQTLVFSLRNQRGKAVATQKVALNQPATNFRFSIGNSNFSYLLLEIPNQQKKLGENHRSSPSSCALTIEQLTVSPL